MSTRERTKLNSENVYVCMQGNEAPHFRDKIFTPNEFPSPLAASIQSNNSATHKHPHLGHMEILLHKSRQ